MSKQTDTERAEAVTKLLTWLKPGSTITTVLRHCSRSGMSRSISLVINGDDAPYDISYWAARAMGRKIDQSNGGIKISGCGMDMGFALVYNLGRTMFPEGFTLPQGKRGRNGDTSGVDTDGGYALSHRWL